MTASEIAFESEVGNTGVDRSELWQLCRQLRRISPYRSRVLPSCHLAFPQAEHGEWGLRRDTFAVADTFNLRGRIDRELQKAVEEVLRMLQGGLK